MLAALLLLLPLASAQDSFGVTASAGVGWLWFDEGENLEDTWSAVPRLGYQLTPRFVIEAETGIHQGRTRGFGYRYDALTPRVNAIVFITTEYPVVPYVAAGPGLIYKRVSRDPNTWSAEPLDGRDLGNYTNPDTDFLINVGPGVLVRLAGAMSLRLDLRYLHTMGTEPHGEVADNFSDWEVTAGFLFQEAERNKDTDGDGLLDKVDACVEIPEDHDRFEDEDGCPDEDNDEDGIVDEEDRCPDDPEDHDGYKDRDGCPEDDNDKDGLLDDEDNCPNEAEDKDGFKDRDGCPDPDNDEDGILDEDDRCPRDPEDVDGYEDGDGCVDPDNDHDAILDAVDSCRDIPEIYNGLDDFDGCPDELPPPPVVPPEIERFSGVIHGINFEVNSDRITVDSYRILDEAADVLIRYPEVHVQVQGHTDSDGSDTYNNELSHRRAEAVVRYLINRGVPPERLSWMGYGESRPLMPNDNEEGKAINRRVEFHLQQSLPN